MATLRRYFTKKMSKDIDKNFEGKYSVTDDLVRQASASSTDGVAGNSETGERRRMRPVSISRSGRFKQKKRERGALQDRPDLYQNPSKQDTADETASGESKQDSTAAVFKQTTPSNNNFVRRVPADSEGVDLYQNQSKQELANESSTDDGLRENTTATYKQTTSSNSKNNNSISKMVRPGYKGADPSGRLTTQATMV